MRLEPDTILIDQADDCDWDVEETGRDGRDVIERAVRGRIEDCVTPQGGETGGLLVFGGRSQ